MIILNANPYIHVHVMDKFKSCYVNMMLCKYMFTCSFFFLVHQNYGMKYCSLSAFLLSIAKFDIHVQCILQYYLSQN